MKDKNEDHIDSTIEGTIEFNDLNQAMAHAMSTLPEAVLDGTQSYKDRFGKGREFDYATKDSVIDAIVPHFADHGILVLPEYNNDNPEKINIRIRFIGYGTSINSGWMSMPSNPSDSQKYGACMTYATRYSLVSATLLKTRDMELEDFDGFDPEKTVEQPVVSDEQAKTLSDLIQKIVDKDESYREKGLKDFYKLFKCKNCKQLKAQDYEKAHQVLKTRLASCTK